MKNHYLRLRFYLFLLLPLVFLRFELFAQCDCDFVISLSAVEWQFDGAQKGVKPGDKICFTNGTRTGISMRNIHGTPENPVIITNMCDGKVILDAPSNWGNVMEVTNSSYFRLTGSGNPNEEMGIEMTGAQMGLNVLGLSTNFEIDHLYVHDVGCVGIVGKTDPTCDPATWRGNFTLRDASFHHNRIENTGCEGFYIGNSHYDSNKKLNCGGSTITVEEHDVDGIQVYNNTLRNIGNDGIQVGSAKNTVIHHNYVYNTGVSNNLQHQNLIQVGNGSQAIVYNNFVDTGKGYGLFDTGGGSIYYNNVVLNALLGGMLLQDTGPNWAPTGFRIFNNTFINCKDFGVLMFSEHTDPTQYFNNIVVGQNQPGYVYVNFNNPSKNKWVDSNNIKTQDITTVKFTDPSAKDFTLLAGSPAIDAGKDIAGIGVVLDVDYDGKPRPRNDKFDLGAYEFQTSGPVANAGEDKGISLPTNSIILNGSGISATGITAYKWTKKSGGAATLTNDETASLTVTDLVEGTYVFQLQVTDADGFDFDEVTVTVSPEAANQNPTANAGSDREITLPISSIVLTGIGTDPDGSIASYAWIKVSGPTATLSGENTNKLTASDLLEGTYVFQLTVTDDKSATASDKVQVIVHAEGVNAPPVISVPAQKTIFLPTNQTTLTATANDSDGTIKSILWTKKSGGQATLANESTLSLTASGLALGTYVFRITVTDDDDASSFAEVTVKVLQANQSPSADAGPDLQLTLPTNAATIEGTGTDEDGTIQSYSWVKVSGPTATLAGQNTSKLEVTDMVQGAYVFGLTVTDDDNATGYDEVTIAVSVGPTGPNEIPLAIAGGNASFSLPTNSVNLYGSGFDPDGSIVSYSWVKASGGQATLTNTDKPTLTVSNLQSGQYHMRLTVTDDAGAVDDDIAIITVSDAGTNIFPVASAGPGKIVKLPQNSVLLKGSGVDADGQVVAYSWVKVSGGSATIVSPTAAETNVTGLTEGTYVFRLTVTDDQNATDQNEVTVRVVSTTYNLPPVVDAGSDLTIYLPQNSVELEATATDEGAITTFEWAKLGGPSATLVNPTELDLTVQDLVEGEYTFQLIVTDNNAASVFDIVRVTVLPASFTPPSVNAGEDQAVTLPVNQTTLTGTASSAGGTIVSTTWAQVLGPAATVSGENTLTLDLSNLIEGTYVFKLTVTDDSGKEASDIVQVVVNPVPPNQRPVVDAGVNQSLLLPISTVNLTGTAIDTDGTVTAVQWSQVTGPAAVLENANTLAVTISGLQDGTYIFRLTATDDEGATGSGDVIVFITDPASTGNRPPIVYAGDDVVLFSPDLPLTIKALSFDPDGTIVENIWEQVSGPSANFSVNDTELQLTDLAPGVYGFRFTATDDADESSSDDVVVSVIDQSDEIPKFFSPNNDGIGDVWAFRNQSNYLDCSLQVFSRTGKIVFTANPYQHNWDGTGLNGELVSDGDYYYVLIHPDGRQIKGALRIIR